MLCYVQNNFIKILQKTCWRTLSYHLSVYACGLRPSKCDSQFFLCILKRWYQMFFDEHMRVVIIRKLIGWNCFLSTKDILFKMLHFISERIIQNYNYAKIDVNRGFVTSLSQRFSTSYSSLYQLHYHFRNIKTFRGTIRKQCQKP